MAMTVRRLELREPLHGEKGGDPLVPPERGESIVGFNLARDGDESGRDSGSRFRRERIGAADSGEIPAGCYLFIQGRGSLDDTTMDEAVQETSKEAAWRGLIAAPAFQLRLLREEETPVWQVFRPIQD